MPQRKESPPTRQCTVADVDDCLRRLSITRYPKFAEDIKTLIKRKAIIESLDDAAMKARYHRILTDLIYFIHSERATKCQPTRTTSNYVGSLIEQSLKDVKYFSKQRLKAFEFLNEARRTRETFEVLSAIRIYLLAFPPIITGDRTEKAQRAIAARHFNRFIQHTLIPIYGCIKLHC